MKANIVFATTNDLKFQYAKMRLEPFDIHLDQVKMDVPELQGKDVVEIAEYSASYAGEMLHRITIKTDVAFEIQALNGFPGPFIRYINEWLAPEKILRLMQDEIDRHARFIDAISLYEPGQGCTTFLSITEGIISNCVTGENGWGIDRVFIPDGYTETLADMTHEKKAGVWDHTHWEKLAQHLQNKE